MPEIATNIYMVIPIAYEEVYNKLLIYMANYGEDILKDCNAACNEKGKNLLTCWSMFQSAVANYNSGNTEKAQTMINFVEYQIDLV